jgi:hypothetical protein
LGVDDRAQPVLIITSTPLMSLEKPAKLKFPVWAFLNQPLFNPTFRVILNPSRFQQLYQLQLLERCLQKQSPRNVNSRY